MQRPRCPKFRAGGQAAKCLPNPLFFFKYYTNNEYSYYPINLNESLYRPYVLNHAGNTLACLSQIQYIEYTADSGKQKGAAPWLGES